MSAFIESLKKELIKFFLVKELIKLDFSSVCINITGNVIDGFKLIIFRDYFTNKYNGKINADIWLSKEKIYDMYFLENILPYLIKDSKTKILDIKFEWIGNKITYKNSSLSSEYKITTSKFLSLRKICLTGTLSLNRTEYQNILELYGAELTNSITRNTNYLVVGKDPGDIKVNSAKNKGVKIITEEQLNRMLFFNKELF